MRMAGIRRTTPRRKRAATPRTLARFGKKLCVMRPTVESKIQAFILHWNRPEECLKTVAAFQNQDVSISICVIDNASRLEKFELLHRRLPDGVELVRLEENKGWGGGHNVGLKRWLENETSEFCVVSAHDALPKEGCLEQLTEAMQANPEFGMVCPQYEGGE